MPITAAQYAAALDWGLDQMRRNKVPTHADEETDGVIWQVSTRRHKMFLGSRLTLYRYKLQSRLFKMSVPSMTAFTSSWTRPQTSTSLRTLITASS